MRPESAYGSYNPLETGRRAKRHRALGWKSATDGFVVVETGLENHPGEVHWQIDEGPSWMLCTH
jgi:hypothetical protein